MVFQFQTRATNLTLLVIVCALVVAACDSQPFMLAPTPATPCKEGASRYCDGPAGCTGERVCHNGVFEACVCADIEPPALELGGSCTRDDECPESAFCLGRDDTDYLGGGAVRGMCVADCTQGTEACGKFANAVCALAQAPGAPSRGLCFPTCTLGDTTHRCGESKDLACAPLKAGGGRGYCRPLCSRDAQCAIGYCHPKHGVCVRTEVRDTNFGARCAMPAPDAGISSDAGGAAEAGTQPLQAATDAGSAADAAGEDTDAQTWPVDAALAADANSDATAAAIECNGLCVQINQSQTAAVCSRLCVFGEAGECAPASGGLRRGGCLFKTPGAAGVGDLGYCGELCDCTGDCSEPSFVCDAFDDPTLERVFARKGVCTDSSLVVGRPLPCKR